MTELMRSPGVRLSVCPSVRLAVCKLFDGSALQPSLFKIFFLFLAHGFISLWSRTLLNLSRIGSKLRLWQGFKVWGVGGARGGSWKRSTSRNFIFFHFIFCISTDIPTEKNPISFERNRIIRSGSTRGSILVVFHLL